MSVIIVDSTVSARAYSVQDALDSMADICIQLGSVIERVTMPGGGLESSKMKAALHERVMEAQKLAKQLRAMSEDVSYETMDFLHDIEDIDSFIY